MTVEAAFGSLVEQIREKKSRICVIGLGQVGLPTAISFLNLGFNVYGYDVNATLIQKLNQGISHMPEKGFAETISKHIKDGSFSVTTEEGAMENADVIVICVATPLDESNTKANLMYLKKAVEAVSRHINRQKLVIIESSIPPRTMKVFVVPLIERLSAKKAAKDFLISFCPERIAPGNSLQEFSNNARVIGADDDTSYQASYHLYSGLTKGGIFRADMTSAEIAKLAENSYRDLNIAFANELALICEQAGADVMKVIELANTHPRVHIHKPGPGVGGPCLPKDPYLLIMGRREGGSLIRLARSVNDSMPAHVIKILRRNVNATKAHRKNLEILVLGTSYKPDVNDARYSPTEAIIKFLKKEGFRRISVHDPYSSESFGAKVKNDLLSAIPAADCVVIVTGHSQYTSIRQELFKKGCVVVDAARILDKQKISRKDLRYITLGSQNP
jgi:UDP-N-acetyl-D-mannosaminuronic acid dehydrogenase